MTLEAELAKQDQELTFCRRELVAMAKLASEQHNAMVAYLRKHPGEHESPGHNCEICDAVNKLQKRVKGI